jgi:sec-independent protein translocase protein TatA
MGISVTKLLIVLAIIIVVFGTKRLKNVGTDLGGAIKSFRNAIREEDEKEAGSEVGGQASDSEADPKKGDNG